MMKLIANDQKQPAENDTTPLGVTHAASSEKLFKSRNVVFKEPRGIYSMLFQCWASVGDGVPTLKQHWVNASCMLG